MQHRLIVHADSAHPGQFTAHLEADASITFAPSRQPLVDAARALLACGYAKPTDTLAMRHHDRAYDCFRIAERVGVLALRTYAEGEKTPLALRRWSPMPLNTHKKEAA